MARYQLAAVYSQERGRIVKTDLTPEQIVDAFLEGDYDKYEEEEDSRYEDDECLESVIVREYKEEYDEWEEVYSWGVE